MFRGGNKGMGGGSGGGVFRTFGAAGRAKVLPRKPSATTTDPNPSSSSSISASSASIDDSLKQNRLPLSSPAQSFTGSAPIIVNSGFHGVWRSNSSCDEFDWVSVDGFEEDEEKFVVSPASPSSDEVENAFSALQHYGRVVDYPNLVRDEYSSYNAEREITDYIPSPNDSARRGSSDGSVSSDWLEPSMNLYASGVLHPFGTNKAYDAFHLLRTDPCIKKMVISLSSDKAVWDAVLNNEVVRELRESYYTVDRRIEEVSDEKPGEDSESAVNVVKWIFDNTKAKMMEVMEKISKIVTELFNPPPLEGETETAAATNPFDDKLRVSFLLSVLVMVIVVVGRSGSSKC